MTDRLNEIEERLNGWQRTPPTSMGPGEEDVRFLVDRVLELERLNRDLRLRYGRSAITFACRFAAEDSDEPTTQCAYHQAVADDNARLREVLEFYAERENHIVHDREGPFTMIENDDGRRARKALGRE